MKSYTLPPRLSATNYHPLLVRFKFARAQVEYAPMPLNRPIALKSARKKIHNVKPPPPPLTVQPYNERAGSSASKTNLVLTLALPLVRQSPQPTNQPWTHAWGKRLRVEKNAFFSPPRRNARFACKSAMACAIKHQAPPRRASEGKVFAWMNASNCQRKPVVRLALKSV